MPDKKLPLAFDLAKMSYYAASYGMAAKLAGFYHLTGLQEKTEMTKVDYEEDGNGEGEYGGDPREVISASLTPPAIH